MCKLLHYMILDKKYYNNVQCRYCQTSATLIDSAYVYKKSYGPIWYCGNCGAYVGVHKNTHKPLGILADSSLRNLKKGVHRHFDPIWKRKRMTRQKAYRELAKKLGIPIEKCHVGMFDEEMCLKALTAIKTMRGS